MLRYFQKIFVPLYLRFWLDHYLHMAFSVGSGKYSKTDANS